MRLRLHPRERVQTLVHRITTNLALRMHQHRNGIFKGHTERYNIKHLVYYEKYNRITNAIAREKQLKKWSRIKKIA